MRLRIYPSPQVVPGETYQVGLSTAVLPSEQAQLERIFGASRFETAALVAANAFLPGARAAPASPGREVP